MKVCIFYPNSSTVRAVAVRLLEKGHFVSVYCPREVDRVKAQNIIDELGIVGHEQARIRKSQQNRFSVHTSTIFDPFEVVGILNIEYYYL